jgi:cyclopropane fatty-acyl-phospholipid synthase-like methyltransferase
LLEALPDHSTVPREPEAAARFWVERNVARWQEVLRREQRDGLVVVDVDPFKLHYVWTLWRTGQVLELEWDLQREASREASRKAFSAGEYALNQRATRKRLPR